MAPYRYSISLRITHPSIDPTLITAELGSDPRRSWRAGLERRAPDGELLRGINQQSFWVGSHLEGESGVVALSEALHGLLEKLERHRAFFRRLRDEGGVVEFFIGWFLGSQGGEIIEHSLMARLADLQIDLSLDMYPGEDDETQPTE
jgi:hypothetical protein